MPFTEHNNFCTTTFLIAELDQPTYASIMTKNGLMYERYTSYILLISNNIMYTRFPCVLDLKRKLIDLNVSCSHLEEFFYDCHLETKMTSQSHIDWNLVQFSPSFSFGRLMNKSLHKAKMGHSFQRIMEYFFNFKEYDNNLGKADVF